MSDNISFQTAVQICDVLGKFAEARSGSKPNKDLIMVVKKVDGREALQLTQLSQMNWMQRLVRWLGFGGATLKRVNEYLNFNSPYLPRRFSDLQNGSLVEMLRGHYHQEAVPEVLALKKERLKQMREDRFRGVEMFKLCLAHHNANSRCKVYFSAEEGEKIDLCNLGKNAMGLLPQEDQGHIARKYRAPIYEPKEFGYCDPRYTPKLDMMSGWNAAGFCHEYGLGVKKDLDKAFKTYKTAVESKDGLTSYGAHYNLGRMHLQRKEWQQAEHYLTNAEGYLNVLLHDGKKRLEVWAQRRANKPDATADMLKVAADYEIAIKAGMKRDTKSLIRVFQAQIELHKQNANQAKLEKVLQKLQALNS